MAPLPPNGDCDLVLGPSFRPPGGALLIRMVRGTSLAGAAWLFDLIRAPGREHDSRLRHHDPVVSPKALVIGYGNPLRGDDAIGQAAAELLAGTAVLDGAEVIACHQLLPELAERIAGVTLAVFVDAEAGREPGRIVVARVQAAAQLSADLIHHVDPAALLFLASRLYGHAPEAHLVAVGAASFDLGAPLSQTVAAALPHVIATVRQLVLDHLRSG